MLLANLYTALGEKGRPLTSRDDVKKFDFPILLITADKSPKKYEFFYNEMRKCRNDLPPSIVIPNAGHPRTWTIQRPSIEPSWTLFLSTKDRQFTSLLHHMSLLLCRFLGRLHDAAIHAHRRQASEKRQGTKSRLVGSGGCRGLYGDLAAAGVAGMVHWGNRIGWQRRAAGRWRTAGRAERASRRCPAVAVSQG